MSKPQASMQRQIDRLIACQAAQWFERLKDAQDESDGDRNEQFFQWVMESPRHMEAFLSIAGQAPLVRKVFESGAFDLQSLLARTAPAVIDLPLSPKPETDAPAAPESEPLRKGRRLSLWALAATIVTMMIGAVFYYRPSPWQRFETPVGEQRALQLVEGSVVNLNAFSRVEVRFDEAHREVKLPRGEATFKVAPDAKRPFRVHTPGAIVEAVGTQFNVYARPDGTTSIAVLEGKVKVSSERGGSALPVPVAAGEEAQVQANGRIECEQHTDVAEAVAWQQRKLIFKKASLQNIAAEFNRYNKTTRIRVEGIDSDALHYSGAFNADDPQSLAALLMREPDLSVQRNGDEIVIRGR